MRWLGKYSYGIHVFHLPIMVGLMHLGPLSGIIESYPGGLAGLLVATACVVPALPQPYLSFNFYESTTSSLKELFSL